MGSLKGVKVGDELLLGRRTSLKAPTKATPVTVHKVGRTLVHLLRYPDSSNMSTDAYRIDTGVINDNYGHSELWKPEDWAAEQKRDELESALRRHGVEVYHKGPKPIPVLEKLLAVLEEAE